MCNLFVSKCSAKVYGAGKQWAVCTHYSSKHTPIHTCGNVRAHMDFTSCPAIITQTVKNKTQTREERAEQMWACKRFPTVGDPYAANHLIQSVCVRGIHDLFTWEREIWRIQYRLCQNDGLNGHQREKVREFVWWCKLRSISQAVHCLIHTGS